MIKTFLVSLVLLISLCACKKTPAPTETGITGLQFSATNTQAILTYDVPSAAFPCTIEASESSTYSPLVHDIDTALFGSSNSDWREGSYITGTTHTFVLGKRLVARGSDGKNYSRALQAATLHFVRVTCGSMVATGTFTTATIPYGMTYQDVPQLDPAQPGIAMNPTVLDTRSQRIIDPHTGAEIRSFSLASDVPYQPGNPATAGVHTYDGAYIRACGTQLIGPGPGYLCGWPQGDGGTGVIYYLIPSTGESRYLGKNNWNAAYPYINAVDSRFYASNNDTIRAYTYTGNYQQASAGSTASFSTSTVIDGLCPAIHAFNAKFNPSYYCGTAPEFFGLSVTGDYIALQFRRGIQDTYGWVVTIRISTHSVIGAMRADENAQMRWCGIHNVYSLYSEPAFAIQIHQFVPQNPPLGGGPYTTNYTGTATLAPGSTAVTVAGDLACSACGPDPDAPAVLRPGDKIHWADGTNNTDTVTGRTDAQHITLSPTHDPHVPGAKFEGACEYKSVYWQTLQDPMGTDSTGTKTVSDVYWPGTGHDDAVTDPGNHGNDAILTEHWPLRTGDILAGLGTPLSRTISSEPPFAGAFSNCYGNGCVSHPSAGAPGQKYLTDFFKWDGSGADNGKLTLITGQVYKYTHNPDYPKADIKHYAIAGVMLGGAPYNFRDVSGIKSVLPADGIGAYQWCRANVAHECVQNSTAGDEFVNVPGAPALECGKNGSVCLNNFAAYANDVIEIGYDGSHSRVLTGGLTGLRDSNDYPNAKGTGRGEYVIFPYHEVKYSAPARLLMAKRPATCDSDGVNRTTFVRHSVPITAPAGKGVATAAVEFGYEEFAGPNDHFCTSRREACVATSSTVNDAVPFHYAVTESYTRLPCATSCNITVPVLPMHVAYYQVRFYDGSGTLVASSGGGVLRE